MEKYKNRKDVPEKYKWDLTDFYKNETEFEQELQKVKNNLRKLNEYKGCTKSASKLYEFLKLELEFTSIVEDLYVYAYLINDQELGIKENIERKNKTTDLYSELDLNTSFFAPELLSLTKTEYEDLFKKEKRLVEFRSMLDRIYREKEHVLSESEEQIVSELSNAFNNFDDISSNMLNEEHNYGHVILDNGIKEIIASNNYRYLMKNKNRDIRKKVYNSYNKKLNEYSKTSAGLLNSYAKGNNALSKIHKFSNAWEEKLFGWNLSDKVFKSLVNAVEKNTAILQKYYNLKKKVLGYDKLYYYDTKVNMSESDREYSIEDAQDLIIKALEPLKEDYLSKLKKIFDHNYIDYCGYKGKCSGGYSFATMRQDSRILMSFNGDLDSVSTIAHEGGHNVHHQYVLENPLQYRSQASIVSEVASLTNECLLSSYLAKNGKTKEEKLAGIENMLNIIITNLFGAVREGKIEQDMYEEIYKGGTITKELMDDLTKKSYKKYFGKSVSLDKNCQNSWIIRSHYYMNFYLYSYSLSISVATSVASKILNGDKNMLNKYIEFLKVGSDKWPYDAFEILGIDLTKEDIYQEAINYFDNLLNQFENLFYGKQGE